jgi:hypothetical protein
VEIPVYTDGVEWSGLDGSDKVPDINKNKVAVIQSATTTNRPVHRIGTRDARQQAASLSPEELKDTSWSRWPIPVAARSKASICGRALAGMVDSNPTGGMDVFVFCECLRVVR